MARSPLDDDRRFSSSEGELLSVVVVVERGDRARAAGAGVLVRVGVVMVGQVSTNKMIPCEFSDYFTVLVARS